MNALTNPALKPYLGVALTADELPPLNKLAFSHFNRVMTALGGRSEAWENIGIDKQERIVAMLKTWESIFVDDRAKIVKLPPLGNIIYQGIITILKGLDLPTPTAA